MTRLILKVPKIRQRLNFCRTFGTLILGNSFLQAFRTTCSIPAYCLSLLTELFFLLRAMSLELWAKPLTTHSSLLVANSQLSTQKVLKGRQFPGRRWSAKHGTPAKKIIKTIRVPKVRQNVNHQKQISHHIVFRMLSKTIYTHLEMTSFYDDLIDF